MSNPHYLPAVYIQANIINFTVAFDGLQEQLLSGVVKQVRAIEEQYLIVISHCRYPTQVAFFFYILAHQRVLHHFTFFNIIYIFPCKATAVPSKIHCWAKHGKG